MLSSIASAHAPAEGADKKGRRLSVSHIGSIHGRIAAFLRGTDSWVTVHHSAGRPRSPGVAGPIMSGPVKHPLSRSFMVDISELVLEKRLPAARVANSSTCGPHGPLCSMNSDGQTVVSFAEFVTKQAN